jgi:hypothetical protein
MLIVAVGFGRTRLDSGCGRSRKAAIGRPMVARATAAVSSATVGPRGVRSMEVLLYYCFFYSLLIFYSHSHTNSLVVKGCNFQHDAPQVNLGNSLKKAVIVGNIISVRLKPFTMTYTMALYYSLRVQRG